VLRELWIDRVAVGSLALLLGVLAWLLFGGIAAWTGMFAPVLVVAYERLVSKGNPGEASRCADDTARRIAAIHRARAVVFGHTHQASGRWEGELFLGNSGSWAALPPSDHAATTERRLIWLKSDPARPEAGRVGGRYGGEDGPREPRPGGAAGAGDARRAGSLLRHQPREHDAGDRRQERDDEEACEA
jgi:hypothetical protein